MLKIEIRTFYTKDLMKFHHIITALLIGGSSFMTYPKVATAIYNREEGTLEYQSYQLKSQNIKQEKSSQAAYYRGLDKHKKGDYEGAIIDYTQAIKLDSNDALNYNNRGFARYELGNYDGAIADLTQAANLFLQQGNMEEYQKVLQSIRQIPGR